MGNRILDYTRDANVAAAASVWDEGEPTPVVPRGPWRVPAMIAVWFTWITSPPALAAMAVICQYAIWERSSIVRSAFLYFCAVPSSLVGLLISAIAHSLNTSPAAARERAMCRHALLVNVLGLLANVALFVLGLIAMSGAFRANG
jgi:hypothetical protein